jgi:DinB family protein
MAAATPIELTVAMDYHSLTLPQVVIEAEAISKDVERRFGSLSSTQLNWKPDQKRWSVGQCLDHLIAGNRELHRPIDEIIEGRTRTRALERAPRYARFWGRVMVRQLRPEATLKLTAPSKATPSASAIDLGIVRRFVDQQSETIRRIQALDDRKRGDVILTSPFAWPVVYHAIDACRIIVAHERRHLAQAQRVVDSPGFPR